MATSVASLNQIKNFNKMPPKVRRRKATEFFNQNLANVDFDSMNAIEKQEFLNAEIKRIHSNPSGGGLFLIGLGLSAFIWAAVGGFGGFVLFLIGVGIAAMMAYQTDPETILVPFYQAKSQEILPEVRAYQLKEKQELQEIEDKQKEEFLDKVKVASEKAEELFNQLKKNPKLIGSKFDQYREFVSLEIQAASPGQDHINGNVVFKEVGNQILLRTFGVWTSGYVPANDKKFSDYLRLLEREKKRVKELARSTRLPFDVIEYYQEVSRTYYGMHREGGNASIYDEQVITNEVMALKDSLTVQGDYHDNSVQVDRSVSHTTNVANAVIEDGNYDDHRIQKEILKTILKSEDESVSRVELMATIPVKESRLLLVLENLQESQQIKMGNRDSGEIIYQLDRLA